MKKKLNRILSIGFDKEDRYIFLIAFLITNIIIMITR